MQFLKTLFWVAVAVAIVLFSSANWNAVTIDLWGGLEIDIKLPLLIIGAFLLGLLPMLVIHRARMWTLRRRIENMERQATMLNGPASAQPSTPTATGQPLNAPDPQLHPAP